MSQETHRQLRAASLAPRATPSKKRSAQQSRNVSPTDIVREKRQKTLVPNGFKIKGESDQPKHPLSRLEALPAEILEIIFEQSLNVSLVQSFNIIGQKLSSPGFIKRFCQIVYCEVQDALGNVYFVYPGVIGENVAHWRKARERVLSCKFMNASFFKDLATKIEDDERQRLLKVSSYKDPTSKRQLTQYLPVKVYLKPCRMPMTLLRKHGSKNDQVGLILALYDRGLSIDSKSSMCGELLLDLWKECVASKDISSAFDLVEIMQDEDVIISPDMLLWSIHSISGWWTHSFFPFTCDIVGTVAGDCHDNARITASLKAHNWTCDQSKALPVRVEERRRASITRFIESHRTRRDT